MLSTRAISHFFGKDILIFPFKLSNLKGVGYNLTVGRHAWSLTTKMTLTTGSDSPYFLVSPGETVLIMTAETIWVSRRFAGTLHSRVDRVSEGLSSISTTLDPEWIGPLLIAMTHMGPESVTLHHGEPLATVIFHRIEKAVIPSGRNLSGRVDRLQALGIAVDNECSTWLDREYQRDPEKLREKLRETPQYQEFKNKFRKGQAFRRIALPLLPALAVLFGFYYAFSTPGQQLGPVIGALVATLGMWLQGMLPRRE